MTRFYLDTSVAADALLWEGPAARWLDDVTGGPEHVVVSSRLLQTELTRVLRREHRPVSEREDLLGHLTVMPLTDAVLTAAEAITEHVKTLDAIHLASAIRLGSSVVVVSHDATVLRLAEAFGLRTLDPVDQRSESGS